MIDFADKKISFTGNFLNEIEDFKTIYCLMSSGYHSTSIALLLKDYGFDNVSLLHNRTYLETKEALDTIQRVINETDYSYNLIEPNLNGKKVSEIIQESFKNLDKIVELLENNARNYRDYISCCSALKKTSSRKWYTKNIDKKNSVILSGICPYESQNRSFWLRELREKDTYLRVHKKLGNVMYGYPFRDCTNIHYEKLFYNYLISKDYFPEHSKCIICPINVAYMIKKNDFYDCADLRYYNNIKRRETIVSRGIK